MYLNLSHNCSCLLWTSSIAHTFLVYISRCWWFFFFNFYFIYSFWILTIASTSSSLHIPSFLPTYFPSSIICFCSEKERASMNINKDGILSCCKTKHLLLYLGWPGTPVWGIASLDAYSYMFFFLVLTYMILQTNSNSVPWMASLN